MALTIADFLRDRTAPICVKHDESLSVALELMRTHDYTQLPVIDEGDRLVGMVTSDSILQALESLRAHSRQLRVKDALILTRPLDPDDDTAELLSALRKGYAAVVVDLDNKVTGIITGFDASEHLRARSENIMLVEDIENSLKDHIRAAYQQPDGRLDEASLSAAIAQIDPKRGTRTKVSKALKKYAQRCGQPDSSEALNSVLDDVCPASAPTAFEKLTLGSYIDLLLHDSVWREYGELFGIEADAARHMLESVRTIRNSLAHFRDDISAVDRATLKFCAEWLERHPPRQETVTSAPSIVGVPFLEGDPVTAPVPIDEDVQPGEGRYAKLALWLQKRASSEDRLERTFADIEEILGSPLPPSARDHRSWWANDNVSHPWSKLWLEVGWRVHSINLSKQTVIFARMEDRERDYINFFARITDRLKNEPSFVLRSASPQGVSWHLFGRLPDSGMPIGWFAVSFARQGRIRVELYIDSVEKERNKRAFDALLEERGQIESRFGESLSWERLDNRRASRIAAYCSGSIAQTSLKGLIKWSSNALIRLRNALLDPVDRAKRNLTTD
jgi:CBS domain-containing protein